MAITYSPVLTPAEPVDTPAPPRRAGPRDRTAARAVLAAAGVAAVALLASQLGYSPIWDGFIYADAIGDAAARPFRPGALRLAGHASQAYAAIVVAAESLSPGSYWPLLAVNAVLFGVACVGFHRLLRRVFPGPAHRLDRALLAAAFTLQPTLLAAVVQPGLDLPLVPAFIWCVVFLLERRWLALVVTGVALAFTKETGVLLYAALLGTYALWVLVRTPGEFQARALAVLRLAPLALPGIVFVLYLFWRKHFAPAGEPVVWNAGTAMIGQSLLRQLIVPRIDRHLASYLAIVLVLNFAWVATAFIAGGFAVTARRVVQQRSWPHMWKETQRLVSTVPGFVLVLVLVVGYALTRFATYANSRYLLPAISLLFIPFYAALLALPIGTLARRAILGAFALALLGSTVRTIDPVSRALYGTFPFGDHDMLRMTRITHECCGSGRDQLVYSLEFTNFEAVTDDILAAIEPGDSTLIVLPDSTDWYFIERLDAKTNRRTMRRAPTFAPTVVEIRSMGPYVGQFRGAYYIGLPNGSAPPARGLRRLANVFVVGPERRFSRGGYSISVYPLTPRSGRGGEQVGPAQ